QINNQLEDKNLFFFFSFSSAYITASSLTPGPLLSNQVSSLSQSGLKSIQFFVSLPVIYNVSFQFPKKISEFNQAFPNSF
ncbi:hypothetical protein NDU88_006114, partial [Pleurodeles waltl]